MARLHNLRGSKKGRPLVRASRQGGQNAFSGREVGTETSKRGEFGSLLAVAWYAERSLGTRSVYTSTQHMCRPQAAEPQ